MYPMRTCSILSIGMPFLHNVAQSSVGLIAPNALDRPMRSRCAFSVLARDMVRFSILHLLSMSFLYIRLVCYWSGCALLALVSVLLRETRFRMSSESGKLVDMEKHACAPLYFVDVRYTSCFPLLREIPDLAYFVHEYFDWLLRCPRNALYAFPGIPSDPCAFRLCRFETV